MGGKEDALRLIVALDCIAVTIEHTEERLKLRTELNEDPAAREPPGAAFCAERARNTYPESPRRLMSQERQA